MFLLTKRFLSVLRRIYGLPASITVITGDWKFGKTDFALFLYEVLSQIGLISDCASNIKTENSPIKYIDNIFTFKIWLFSNNRKKLFLYDEVTESAPSRGAMTKLNVTWVRTIPQLSKGRCHLIAITQEEFYADSVFHRSNFCYGIWRKINKTSVILKNSRVVREGYKGNNIPRTNIKFFPYTEATFSLEAENFDLLPIEFKIAKLYDEGKTYREIRSQLGLTHDMQINRAIRRICHMLLTDSHSISEGYKELNMSERSS